ncbi:MAG: PqqD family protein [bacterium]
MGKAYPIFKRENLLYEREEKDECWTIIPKFHPETRELVINKTARKVLELCDGNKTIEEIEKEMNNLYPKVSRDVIERDVNETIGKFSRLLIIEWKGENPFLYRRKEDISNGFSLSIAQEDDILRIKEFMQKLTKDKKKEGLFYIRIPLFLFLITRRK